MKKIPIILPSQWATADGFLSPKFTAMVLKEGSRVVVSERWPTAVPSLTTEDRDAYSDDSFYVSRHEQESLVRRDGVLMYLRLSQGTFKVAAAASSRQAIETALRGLRQRYPVDKVRTGPIIPMVFWAKTQHGANSWRRNLEVPKWEEINANYPPPTRSQLHPMMLWPKPSQGGQLILWYGPPGTGKTWAIRALGSEWRSWCQFEYITDPDEMFADSSYMTNILLAHASSDEEKAEATESASTNGQPSWRCFILEDTGELLATDAKVQQGQKLSRLLNVVDGLLGQGLRILILITTNEEIKTLHPAVVRPGRCLYQVGFDLFSPSEAAEWLAKYDHSATWTGQKTLAQLYHDVAEFPLRDKRQKSSVGFAR